MENYFSKEETILSVALMALLHLPLLLIGCGKDEGSSAEPAGEVHVVETKEASSDPLLSIMLKSKADLPSCESVNDTQLAYIKDEDTFYVCESPEWQVVEIGEKGEKGDDGVTTVVTEEIEATNKKNTWVDPVSGLTWLLGGSGNHALALSSCGNGYRLPTWSEAEVAIAHGIRNIADSVPTSGKDFWIDVTNQYWYATLTSGAPNKYQVLATANYQIFCVK